MNTGVRSTTALQVALDYIDRGWSPVPIPPQSKKPKLPSWPDLRLTRETAAGHFHHEPMNVGIILGMASQGLTDVDLDCDLAVQLAPHVLVPGTASFGRPSRRASHWLYLTDLATTADKATMQFHDPDSGEMLVELRIGGVAGAQTVFPGSIHVSGELISWEPDTAAEPLRTDGADLITRVRLLAGCTLLAKHWPSEGGRHQAARIIGGVMARSGLSTGRIAQLVEATARAANDNEPKDRRDTARDAAEAHAAGKNTYGFNQLRETFGEKVARSICDWVGYHDNSVGLFRAANDNARRHPSVGDLNSNDALPFTDEFMALRFAEKHADVLRYISSRGHWMHYDGARWRQDETLIAAGHARALCRATARTINNPRVRKPLESAKKSAAVVTLAKADPRLAATNEQWDSDPMLLNTPSGVLDLATGELRSHSPDDHMTKITAVSAEGACPVWKQHLRRIMNGNDEMVAYLQRVFGYCLTGLTREHALFFAYGTGANGKSVTINTVAGIMSGYQKSAPIETFTASHTDRHPTELAGLQGARIVTAVETEEGRAWAEARIKTLTGGDPVAARFMRQDFFEYTPQFKLFIAGNHKPALKAVDEAIRRRFHLIPFTVTIPPEERDGQLTERLKSEWPGILAWMVQGCLQWQREGLNPPEAVRTATAEYLEAEDAMKAWVDEACEPDKDAWERAGDLYGSWKAYAERSGEQAGSAKRFSQNLLRYGFEKVKTNRGRGFRGMKLVLSSGPATDFG